jgi:hypothetical protein
VTHHEDGSLDRRRHGGAGGGGLHGRLVLRRKPAGAGDRRLEDAEGNGVSITHDEAQIGGFPLGLAAVIPDLQIRNEAEGASIEAAPIRLSTTLWDPDHLEYDFSGKHSVLVVQGLQTTQATFQVGAGRGEVWLEDGGRTDRMTASDLKIVSRDGIVGIAGLEVSGAFTRKPSDPSAETMQARYSLTGVDLTTRLGIKLIEPPIERLQIELAATGPFLEIFEDSTVVDWAEAGGVVTLRDLTLEWSGLTLTASGSGSFDAELRPSGSVTLVSAGFEESLDALDARGVLPPPIGDIVRSLTQRFIVPGGSGGKSQLIVPVTAAEGILSLGGEPMGRVPSLKRL